MNRTLTAGIAALGLALAGLAAAPALAQDEDDVIEMKDGKKQSGKIKGEELSGVTLTVAGTKAEITLRWYQIKKISYTGSPKFGQARGYVEVGNTVDGIGLLRELAKQSDLRPVLRNHVLNWLGAMEMRNGELDPAIATFNQLFKEFPKTQYLLSAGENLITCYLLKNNAQGAGDALNSVQNTAKSAGVDMTPFGLLKGRVQEAQKDWSNAQSSYKNVADQGADDATKLAGQLGIARCQFAQGKTAEAEAAYRKLVASDKATALVLAGAWNGIGDILYKSGREKRDAEMITDALFAYLRGSVQYVPGPGEPTTEYERAVAGSAKCFTAAAELEQKPDRKKQFADRSRERREYLASKFPNSLFLREE